MRWYPHWADTGYEFEKRRIAGVRLECSSCLAEYEGLYELIVHTETCDGLNWDEARLDRFADSLQYFITRGLDPIYQCYLFSGMPMSMEFYRKVRPIVDEFAACYRRRAEDRDGTTYITYSDVQRSRFLKGINS